MFKVQGLKPLHGKIKVQGAKNAVLPMMAVSLLTEGRTEIRNVPRISDVFLMAEILRDLGCQVMFHLPSRNSPMTGFHQRQAVSTLTVPAAWGLAPRSLVQPGSLNAPPGHGNMN